MQKLLNDKMIKYSTLVALFLVTRAADTPH